MAGVIPSNGFKTLAFDVTDPAIASDSDLLHRIVQTAKTLPRVVLNTSLGFNCAPDENATAGDATNAELNEYLTGHEKIAAAREQQAERMPLTAVQAMLRRRVVRP